MSNESIATAKQSFPTRGGAQLDEVLAAHRAYLEDTLRDLVRIPSENLPPEGNEGACQAYVANRLRDYGLEPDVYELGEVQGLTAHPEYFPGRSYAGRPNVNAVWRGAGEGRSLILSGHIDTVPADTPVEWRHPPFAAEVEHGRLFGRGAWDMKAGVAMNLTVLKVIRELGARQAGNLIFESVADEEFGGVNGTLAARVRGYNADAAVIGEPTSLSICPAQRGGRLLHIRFHGEGGILAADRPSGRVVEQLSYVLSEIPGFAGRRGLRVAVDPYFQNCSEPFAVWVTNIATGRWGWTQPITVPERCWIELYWQTMPAETHEEVIAEFYSWWNETLSRRPDLFGVPPEVVFPMRWLPGCSIPPSAPLVTEFEAAASTLGLTPRVEGLDAPSDMYIFQKCFNTPALMWGPDGANAHQADEFVNLDSLFQATRVLAQFVSRWCGLIRA
jgi:acetylornithine deacetylase